MKKFNVNLILDDESLKISKQVNDEINKICHNEITFNKYIPHLTLLIYFVEDENADKANNIVLNYFKNVKFEKYFVHRLFKAGKWMLLQVKNINKFINMVNGLKKELEGIATFSNVAVSEKHPPHITVGFTEDFVNYNTLNQMFKSFTIVPQGVRISTRQEFGAINDSLFEINNIVIE